MKQRNKQMIKVVEDEHEGHKGKETDTTTNNKGAKGKRRRRVGWGFLICV
jgi:hypothetical protein